MNSQERVVVTANELAAATRDANIRKITVRGNLSNTPTVRLATGQTLSGIDGNASILFDGVDGLQLTSDNQVRGLSLQTAANKRAIFNDTGVAGLGHMLLAGVSTIGQVQILVRDEDVRVIVSAHLMGLSAGRPSAPVRGSGIFVSGAGFKVAGWRYPSSKRARSTATAASHPTRPMPSPAAYSQFSTPSSMSCATAAR